MIDSLAFFVLFFLSIFYSMLIHEYSFSLGTRIVAFFSEPRETFVNFRDGRDGDLALRSHLHKGAFTFDSCGFPLILPSTQSTKVHRVEVSPIQDIY